MGKMIYHTFFWFYKRRKLLWQLASSESSLSAPINYSRRNMTSLSAASNSLDVVATLTRLVLVFTTFLINHGKRNHDEQKALSRNFLQTGFVCIVVLLFATECVLLISDWKLCRQAMTEPHDQRNRTFVSDGPSF